MITPPKKKVPQKNTPSEAGRSLKEDRCGTPSYAFTPLNAYLPNDWVYWEPCRGDGYLEMWIRDAGKRVVSTELMDGQDFFDDSSIPDKWDAILTNPPYSAKVPFMARCFDLKKPFCLLLPLATIASKRAQGMFQEHEGVELILPSSRINYHLEGKGWSGSANFPSVWITWGLNIGRDITYVSLVRTKQIEIASRSPDHCVDVYSQDVLF